MNTPWRVSETDNQRVCILAADNRVVTEIIPGQMHGVPVSQALRLSIARTICTAINLAVDLKDIMGVDKDG